MPLPHVVPARACQTRTATVLAPDAAPDAAPGSEHAAIRVGPGRWPASASPARARHASAAAGVAGLASLFMALAAAAHPGHETTAATVGTAANAVQGLLHPLTGADHLCAMVALGVWSAMTCRRFWAPPLAFMAVLLLGALLGLARLPLPAVEPMIAVSLLVLGLLVALRARLPAIWGAGIAAVFALFHGHAHGHEMPAAASALPYIAGFLAGTLALHCAGMAAGAAMRRASVWLPRVVGAAVATYGALLLAA